MIKILRSLLIIILILGLQLGCSTKSTAKDTNDTSVMVEVEQDVKRLTIPFDQLLYSKNSKNFAWEWSSSEEVPQDVLDKYKETKVSVPGGFLVKETATAYFIRVSGEERSSVTDGFAVSSFTIPSDGDEKDPVLRINIHSVHDENSSDQDMKGKVFVTSLFRLMKGDIPEGISLNEIILSEEN